VAEKAMAGVDRSKSSEGEVSRLQARMNIVTPHASHSNPNAITHASHRNRVAAAWPVGRHVKDSPRNRAALVPQAQLAQAQRELREAAEAPSGSAASSEEAVKLLMRAERAERCADE